MKTYISARTVGKIKNCMIKNMKNKLSAHMVPKVRDQFLLQIKANMYDVRNLFTFTGRQIETDETI